MIVLATTMAATAMRVSGSAPSVSEGRGRALGCGYRGSRRGGGEQKGGLITPAPLPPVATGICSGGDSDGGKVGGCGCGGGGGINGGSG